MRDIQLKKMKEQDIEFHGWECVSLILKNRVIDFVIKDEDHLFMLINFMI